MTSNKNILSILLFLPALVVVIYFSYKWRNYQLDDALIYLRYIKNFQDGLGLVYNPGEKFNGLTSPLFTYINIAGSFFTKNLQILSISLSAIFLTATAFISGKILSKTKLGEAFTALTVASFGFFYTTFGMETTLFLMLITLSIYLYKIKSDYFVIALALLIITRNEGIFLALPMMIDYLVRYKKIPNPKIILAGILIFLTPFVLNYIYYGSPLPATGGAKIGQGKSGFWGEGLIFFNIDYLYNAAFSGQKNIAAALLILSAYGAFISFKDKISIISIIFISLLLAFYGGLNIPNYHWYYAPFFLFALIFSCRGIELILSDLWKSEWPSNKAFLNIITMALVLFFYVKTMPTNVGARNESYAGIGEWLKENTNPESSVAAVEIGTIGWYAERNIIDILGLTNKYNANYIAKSDVFSWLTKYHPDYILRHEPRWVHEGATKSLERQGLYTPVTDFKFSGFVLLKKNPAHPDEQISQISKSVVQNHRLLQSMLKTSNSEPPQVQLDSDGLFAHAPTTLTLELPSAAQKIFFSYGVRETAQGKHHGVCFEIIQGSNLSTVFQGCIDGQANTNEMLVSRSIDIDGNTGDVYLFKTKCMDSCDYAWSYWGDITLK